jgi:hypothetical protein
VASIPHVTSLDAPSVTAIRPCAKSSTDNYYSQGVAIVAEWYCGRVLWLALLAAFDVVFITVGPLTCEFTNGPSIAVFPRRAYGWL